MDLCVELLEQELTSSLDSFAITASSLCLIIELLIHERVQQQHYFLSHDGLSLLTACCASDNCELHKAASLTIKTATAQVSKVFAALNEKCIINSQSQEVRIPHISSEQPGLPDEIHHVASGNGVSTNTDGSSYDESDRRFPIKTTKLDGAAAIAEEGMASIMTQRSRNVTNTIVNTGSISTRADHVVFLCDQVKHTRTTTTAKDDHNRPTLYSGINAPTALSTCKTFGWINSRNFQTLIRTIRRTKRQKCSDRSNDDMEMNKYTPKGLHVESTTAVSLSNPVPGDQIFCTSDKCHTGDNPQTLSSRSSRIVTERPEGRPIRMESESSTHHQGQVQGYIPLEVALVSDWLKPDTSKVTHEPGTRLQPTPGNRKEYSKDTKDKTAVQQTKSVHLPLQNSARPHPQIKGNMALNRQNPAKSHIPSPSINPGPSFFDKDKNQHSPYDFDDIDERINCASVSDLNQLMGLVSLRQQKREQTNVRYSSNKYTRSVKRRTRHEFSPEELRFLEQGVKK